VTLLGRLLRAEIRAGAILSARSTRQRAIEVAEGTGHNDLVSLAHGASSGPALSLSGPNGLVDPAVVDTFVDRLIARADVDPAVLDGLSSPSADGAGASGAAERRLAAARAIGDPLLLACALSTMAAVKHKFRTDRRELLVAEVRALGYAHDLPANRWVREHIGGMAAGAHNDPAGVRRHAAEGLALARRHRLVEAEAINLSTMAMLAHVTGHFDEAEAGYTDVRDRLRGKRSSHGDFVHALGLFTIRLSRGAPQEIEPLFRMLHRMSAPEDGNALGPALTRQGRYEQLQALRPPFTPVPDHLYGIALVIRAELALRLCDLTAARALITLLLPIRDQLAGAASTSFVSRPFALSLGELYRLLGDEPEAQVQFAHAEKIARQWGSAHLVAAARTAAATAP
jgi:hypothetical protein